MGHLGCRGEAHVEVIVDPVQELLLLRAVLGVERGEKEGLSAGYIDLDHGFALDAAEAAELARKVGQIVEQTTGIGVDHYVPVLFVDALDGPEPEVLLLRGAGHTLDRLDCPGEVDGRALEVADDRLLIRVGRGIGKAALTNRPDLASHDLPFDGKPNDIPLEGRANAVMLATLTHLVAVVDLNHAVALKQADGLEVISSQPGDPSSIVNLSPTIGGGKVLPVELK